MTLIQAFILILQIANLVLAGLTIRHILQIKKVLQDDRPQQASRYPIGRDGYGPNRFDSPGSKQDRFGPSTPAAPRDGYGG